MNRETLAKANKLNDRIEHLLFMKRDLRPQFCSGVAFSKIANANHNENNYQYHLWGTTPDSEDDDAVVMRIAIETMYNKVCELLEVAELDLKNLSNE